MLSRITIAAVLVWLVAGTPIAEAQELAGSFDQLRVLVKRGDTVTLTDAAGREVTGKVVDLSSAALALQVADTRQEFPAADVSTIRQRRQDSLENGAKWGFATGLGLGLLGGLSVAAGHAEIGVGTAAIIALFYGGLGAGVGVGLDAMVKGNQVIYAKARSSASSITVAPVVSRGRRAIQVSIGF